MIIEIRYRWISPLLQWFSATVISDLQTLLIPLVYAAPCQIFVLLYLLYAGQSEAISFDCRLKRSYDLCFTIVTHKAISLSSDSDEYLPTFSISFMNADETISCDSSSEPTILRDTAHKKSCFSRNNFSTSILCLSSRTLVQKKSVKSPPHSKFLLVFKFMTRADLSVIIAGCSFPTISNFHRHPRKNPFIYITDSHSKTGHKLNSINPTVEPGD